MQWNKLKAVMLRFISWCTLDIHISIDNCRLLKLHQSQTLQRIFGQQLSNLARTMISKLLAGKHIYFKSKINNFRFITWRK